MSKLSRGYIMSGGGILRLRYKTVEETLSMMDEFSRMDVSEIEGDRRLAFALRATVFFYAQGLMDLANLVVAQRDLTPKNHREILELLIRAKLVEDKYEDLLAVLVDIRNELLFLYEDLDIGSLYEFVRKHKDVLNELYHKMIRLGGEVE